MSRMQSLLLVLVLLFALAGAPVAWAGVVDADLAITKTDGAASSTPGAAIVYTITATNNGPADTTATVTDNFPGNVNSCTWTCVASAGSSCTAAGAGNLSDGVSLLNGGTATYTATCTVNLNAAGTIDNTASIAGVANDPNMANNSATDSNTVTPTADLSITKTDGAVDSTPGSTIVYTIVASNAGPSATTATVTDTFPASLTGCTWVCVASAGSTCGANGAGNINDGVSLLNGGTATYTATCDIDPAASGNLNNTASIAGAVADPNMANNSATDSNTLTGSADIIVSVNVTPNPVGISEPFSISITVFNNGPSTANNVVVNITLPAGYRAVPTEVEDKATLVGTTGCVEDPSGVPTCTIGTLAAGAQADVTVQAIGSATPGTGDITVSATSSTADPNGANNLVVVSQAFDITIPTLGEWSLLLLALMLGAAALLRMRRQRVRIDN